MQKAKTTLRIESCGAMAIVRVQTIERGIEIAQGCLDGGIDVLEISYTLPNAGQVITALKERFKDQLLVGAGTVLDSETARLAILAGAEFVISPNFNQGVAVLCNRYQIPYAPGCTSVTEMVEAMEAGAAFIKAFPISDFYQEKLVKVLKTPIPNMPILASGGINLDNLHSYIKNGCDCCGFGGLLTSGTSNEITKNAQEIKRIIDETRKTI